MNDYSVRVFIIEDNFAQKKQIQDFVRSYLKENTSLNIEFMDTSFISEFYKSIPSQKFFLSDLFIIDYNLLSNYNGIDLARKLVEYHPKAVIGFLTAYKDKAREVINAGVSAVAYGLKNPNPKIFDFELSRLLKLMLYKLEEYDDSEKSIALPIGDSVRIIPCKDIFYICTQKNERNKIFIQTEKNEYIANFSWKKMKSLLSDQDHFQFFKSYIININSITKYNRSERLITFRNEKILYIGVRILDKIIPKLK
ncbi:LytTR family transcriptional regulator DNA-binding domain-containing protein [Enterococcus gilvus]|uniref:LytR/AlgR family response regulator transcription factor n=1 Tax=Enterococcus gilvus TaxID=160453 RepID=UPI003D6AED70